MPIDISKGWVARKGLSVDDSLRRGRCRSQVGPTGSTLFAAFKRNKPWITIRMWYIRLYQFFCGFFLLAFPRNILNHLQNRKQLKKNKKKSYHTNAVCLFVFFVQGDWIYGCTTILNHHFSSPFVESPPTFGDIFFPPKQVSPRFGVSFYRLVFPNEILRLQRWSGIQPLHLTFLRLRWEDTVSWWLATRNPGSTHPVEGNGSEHPNYLQGFFFYISGGSLGFLNHQQYQCLSRKITRFYRYLQTVVGLGISELSTSMCGEWLKILKHRISSLMYRLYTLLSYIFSRNSLIFNHGMKSVLAVSWEIRSTSFLKIILNNICIYTLHI